MEMVLLEIVQSQDEMLARRWDVHRGRPAQRPMQAWGAQQQLQLHEVCGFHRTKNWIEVDVDEDQLKVLEGEDKIVGSPYGYVLLEDIEAEASSQALGDRGENPSSIATSASAQEVDV